MFNPMDVVKVAQAHNLSEVMIGAIVSGDQGELVTAGPKQIKALVERGIVSEEDHTLTEFGELLCRLFTAPDTVNAGEMSDLLTSNAPSARGSFLVDVHAENLTDMIRPCENGEEGLSFAAAKEQLADHIISERDRYRDLLKAVRSLRKKDVTDESEGAPMDESEGADESVPVPA